MAPITINGNTIDPLKQAHQFGAMGLMALNAEQSDYILI
jgi:hypothetical protein